MCRNHRPVGVLVEFNSEIVKPLDYGRSLVYQSVDKLRLSVEVSAAERVKIVLGRRVVGLVSRLDSAFCHHRVRVAYAQFRYEKDFCSRLACHNSGRRSRSASADDEDVRLVVNVVKVHLVRLDARLCLKHVRKLVRSLLPFVRTDFKLLELACYAVGMVFLKKLIFFVSRKACVFKFQVFVTFCRYNLCGFV